MLSTFLRKTGFDEHQFLWAEEGKFFHQKWEWEVGMGMDADIVVMVACKVCIRDGD